MRNYTVVISAALLGGLGMSLALSAAEVPTTQPAIAADAATAVAPATQPMDLKAVAMERHKHMDKRWREFNESLRKNERARIANTPIAKTFKPGTLVTFSIPGGVLKIESEILPAAGVPTRVAVEGSNAVWIFTGPGMLPRRAGAAVARPSYSLTRYDLDAKEDEFWQSRILFSDRRISLWAQNAYGTTSLMQFAGAIRVHVGESMEMGKPAVVIYTGQAPTLAQLRAEQPEEFRLYVLPLLNQFADASFLQPGAADIYSAFVEIPADQKVTQELDELLPQLDAYDPLDRAAASDKLCQLGAAGVLAALRTDDSGLTEEQKLRLRAFIATFRRRPTADPAARRQDKNFLVDCLECDDPAARAAAKVELQEQLHQQIDFDLSLTGDTAATAADAVRKQLLKSAPPPATQPATRPVPQV